jgi:hypothetical protein
VRKLLTQLSADSFRQHLNCRTCIDELIHLKGKKLASSFKQAAALADAQDKERAAQAYIHLDLKPYYEKKYSLVFQSCLASTDHPDTSPLSFVAAIGKDGRVLRLYIDHETNIFACVWQTL